jgi:nitrite reductase/ring-hydroxylating ferredoxin subunit
MDWYKIPDVQDPHKAFIKKVKAGGKNICLVGYEGEVYALGATCPHAGAELSGGWCKDGKIICPFHRYSYSLQTGRGDPGQNDYVDTYPVEVREDGVYVGIASFGDKWKQIFK